MNPSDKDIEMLIDAKEEEECEHEWENGRCINCDQEWEPDDFSGATPGDR